LGRRVTTDAVQKKRKVIAKALHITEADSSKEGGAQKRGEQNREKDLKKGRYRLAAKGTPGKKRQTDYYFLRPRKKRITSKGPKGRMWGRPSKGSREIKILDEWAGSRA